jgi:hypothetical protein
MQNGEPGSSPFRYFRKRQLKLRSGPRWPPASQERNYQILWSGGVMVTSHFPVLSGAHTIVILPATGSAQAKKSP